MNEEQIRQREITNLGNPAKPSGEAGAMMLERMNQSHDAVTNWGLDFLELEEHLNVMDLGCGGGATLHRLYDRGVRHLTGADYSEVSVSESIRNNQELVQSGVLQVVQASVEHLPFADHSFDMIVTVESFYFWPDPEENLKEVHRVLKKGGHLLVILDTYENGALSEETRENIRQYHMTVPTEKEFMELFRKAGFVATSAHLKPGTSWIAAEGIA